MRDRLLIAAIFAVTASTVFWVALVHTVHSGTLTVPDLRGKTLDEARQTAHDRGLTVDVDDQGVFSPQIPSGSVALQEPPPGFHVKGGAHLRVRLSLGSERVKVPGLRDESISNAARLLQDLGLEPGRQAQVAAQADADSVLASSPPGGTEVAPATTVDLLSNTTPRQPLWVAPSFLGHSLTQVRTFCRSHRFRLGQVHGTAYPGVPSGVVLRQYPAAGSPLSRSDIIALWVSQ